MSLIDTGCTLSVGDGVLGAAPRLPACTNVSCMSSSTSCRFVGLNDERRRIARDEAGPRRRDDVAAGRHVRKRHLSGAVGQRLGEDQAVAGARSSTCDAGHVHGALERRDGRRRHVPGSQAVRLAGTRPQRPLPHDTRKERERRRSNGCGCAWRPWCSGPRSIGQCRSAVDQMMPHDASTVLGDRCVRRVDGLGVHVVRPRREDAQRSQLARGARAGRCRSDHRARTLAFRNGPIGFPATALVGEAARPSKPDGTREQPIDRMKGALDGSDGWRITPVSWPFDQSE